MKSLGKLKEILLFLFALAIFFYSGYKIAVHTGILKNDILGAECGSCFSCDACGWCDDFCRELEEWCRWGCPQPSPTPTPTILPTPTPTPVEITPTPIPEIQPTITPTPSPTPAPEVPPAVGGPGEPFHCGAAIPPAPTLSTVNRVAGDRTNLNWTAVAPVTHYLISYGLLSGNYIYGVPNTGNVISFTVGGLQVGADYCFAVRAVNDCVPSELSNEICTGAVLGVSTGKILGVSTLGATGGFTEQIGQILFIIGCVCFSFGLRLFTPYLLVKRLA